MTTYNEQEAMQTVAERFAKAAEELRLSGAQLFRDGIVTNDQVLSKIKNGWQKPTKKAIELFCQKYGVSAAWMYTGEGNMYIGRSKPFEQHEETDDDRPLYRADFLTCIGSDGELVPGLDSKLFTSPMTGDVDFWCTNSDKSLAPAIMPGDIIALKKLGDVKEESIPGGFICVVITKQYKVLRKVSVIQDDPDCITFIQMDEGKPVESKTAKDNIIAVYQVVFHFKRM